MVDFSSEDEPKNIYFKFVSVFLKTPIKPIKDTY